MIRRILFYLFWACILIAIVLGYDFVLFIPGTWYLLIAIYIKRNECKILKLLLADFLIGGEYNSKKAFVSGTLLLLLGGISYLL
ncbi:hypothetical protein [Bacillus sp. FJAT-27445]|uniref:hypothetical protein n=1 Tax=Bacillus sp. FJAT-27445 TaxID=1679166 RepID=UPI0007438C2D|nr:hypothetical protein [Bacillus sp. FJAT-27445]